MTINDSFAASSDVRSTQVGQPQPAEVEQQTRQQESEARSDSASLSSLGTELARSIANESPEEVSRVDRLEEAVNGGTLQAPAQEIAAGVIQEAVQGTELEIQAGNDNAPPSPV